MTSLLRGLIVAALAALLTSACNVSPPPDQAQKDPLVGAWRAQVRFNSGALMEMRDLQFMYVFNAGGTMTESSNYDGSPPGPPAYGIWRKTAPREFEATYEFYNTKPPATFDEITKGGGWLPNGRGVLSENIKVSDDGSSFQSTITYTSIPGLDWIVAIPLGAAVVTAFVVTGVASAINIIDGLNGLSSMCAALVLAGVAYVAMQVGDMTVAWLALAGICALFGFFVLNYPGGRVFLGDGGAYVVGFYVAEVGILLLHRNPQVSPLCPLLLCIYPVFETVFSMYRRRVLRARSPGLPDGIHLHSLIYRRLMRWSAGAVEGKRLTRRNSMTSPYLWLLCMLAVLPAMLFWDNTALLGTLIVVFGFAYTLLYWRIVRFRSPRWLRAPARARRPVGEVPGQG